MRLATRISVITFLTVTVAAGLAGTSAITLRTAVLRRDFARSAVAVNHDTAEDGRVVTAADEVAIIPPVSGG